MLCEELCNDNTIWYVKIRECIDYEYRYSFKNFLQLLYEYMKSQSMDTVVLDTLNW
jgi:hypothetical protein